MNKLPVRPKHCFSEDLGFLEKQFSGLTRFRCTFSDILVFLEICSQRNILNILIPILTYFALTKALL
jgi:hypothetical protein